eukprot:1943382-Lingulodinium_polyedra.AAC.1
MGARAGRGRQKVLDPHQSHGETRVPLLCSAALAAAKNPRARHAHAAGVERRRPALQMLYPPGLHGNGSAGT